MGIPDRSAHRRPDLVEREAELDMIDGLVEQARAGQGTVGVVEAAAGIGKTSLLRVGLAGARERGLRVLRARGSEIERDSPFGVVRQLLEPAALAGGPSDRAAIFADAASLARPVFGLAGSPESTSAQLDPGHAVLHGLYWLLANLAARTPLVACVDDVDWADAPSVRFLTFLSHRLDGLPVLLLLAGRPTEDTPTAGALEGAVAGAGARFIRPAALSDAGVAQMIAERMGQQPAGAFTTACAEVTRGNPFYLSELLAELAQRELRPIAEHAAAVHGLAPRGIGRAALRATSRLPAGARDLLEAVAILGDPAGPEHVRRLAGLEAGTAADATQALVQSSILERGRNLAFAHPIARAAVYEGLAPTDRAARHAAAVGILREAGADPDRVAAQLLLTASGTVPDTAVALELAADVALRRGAPEVAVRYLRRALAEPIDAARRVSLSLALGEAATSASSPEAEDLLREALELAERGSDRADAGIALARLLMLSGQTTRAVDVLAALTEGLSATDPASAHRLDLEFVATADADLAVRSLFAARVEETARRARATAPEGDPFVLAHRATDALRTGESAAVAGELALMALSSDVLQRSSVGRTLMRPLLIWVVICAERYEAARDACDEVLASARADGSAQLFVIGSAFRSMLHVRAGALADCEAEARQALDVASLNGWQPLQIMALMGLMETTVDRGGASGATLLSESASVNLDAIETAQAAAGLYSRGRLRIATGDVEGGCRDLLECGRRFLAWGMSNPAVFPWRSEAALALVALGERERARQLVAEELDLARRWGTPRTLGVSLRAHGLVETGPTRLELLSQAVSVLRRSGAGLEHGRALIDLGAEFRRSGRRVEARDPLRRGVDLAQASGADILAQRGRVELRAAGARSRTPVRRGVDALTPSEARIAQMAAAGRSNPEIAQALFLTVKTIEMHLTGAYRKLDISSRVGLADALAA